MIYHIYIFSGDICEFRNHIAVLLHEIDFVMTDSVGLKWYMTLCNIQPGFLLYGVDCVVVYSMSGVISIVNGDLCDDIFSCTVHLPFLVWRLCYWARELCMSYIFSIGTVSTNSLVFRVIRLQMYIENYFDTWRWRYMALRWRHSNLANSISSVIAAKQTVINEVYVFFQ